MSHPSAPLEERWLSIPANVWHQGAMGSEHWAVVSFHTVLAEQLIEERPAIGRGETVQRTYIPQRRS